LLDFSRQGVPESSRDDGGRHCKAGKIKTSSFDGGGSRSRKGVQPLMEARYLSDFESEFELK
jgi:hypothetical protein